jgi:hypothetical protein
MCVGSARTARIISGDIIAMSFRKPDGSLGNAPKMKFVPGMIPTRYRPKVVMTMSDKQYDCKTCPYPRYKDGNIIFCDVCIRRILDEKKKKKEREENADGQ